MISASEWQLYEKKTHNDHVFDFQISIQYFEELWLRVRKIKTNSELTVFYLCFVWGNWDVSPFSHLWASLVFLPKTLHDVTKPCISSIATIILQITCFMVWFSCRGDAAPSTQRHTPCRFTQPSFSLSFPTEVAVCIDWITTHHFLSVREMYQHHQCLTVDVFTVSLPHFSPLRSWCLRFMTQSFFAPFLGIFPVQNMCEDDQQGASAGSVTSISCLWISQSSSFNPLA